MLFSSRSTLADFNLARTGPSSLVMRAHSLSAALLSVTSLLKDFNLPRQRFCLGWKRARKSDPGRRSPPTFAAWQHAFSPLCQRRKVEFPAAGRGTLFWKTLPPIISVHLVILCEHICLGLVSGCEIDWIGVICGLNYAVRNLLHILND
jgi:hypothetical protein